MVLELQAREKAHGGSACSATTELNFFLLGISECAMVSGVLTHPHVSPETHPTKITYALTKLPIIPTCGVPLVITSSYSLTHVGLIWLDIMLFRNNSHC